MPFCAGVDAITRRVRGAFSLHQARCIPPTVWTRCEPIQVHVRAWSPAPDAGRYWLHRPARTESSSDGNAVPTCRQGLQGTIFSGEVLTAGCSCKPFIVLTSYTHAHTRSTALFPELPEWAGTRKVKPIWIVLKQETVRGIGISWDICKSAPHSRQITTPAPHHSVSYRCPSCRPNNSVKALTTSVTIKLPIKQQQHY